MQKKRFFSFKTKEGSLRLLALFVALIIVFSLLAQVITTQGYKINISDVVINVRGADLHMEMYAPADADNNSSLPCILLTHGGSESLSADSMMASEMARRGFVVLNISAYGAGLSDQPQIVEDGTTGLDGARWNRGATMGMWDAYQYALSLDIVDPTRICAWAHSTGRHLFTKMVSYYHQNLTLNDRLINVLYNDFSLTFTEEEITQDADVFAKERLSTFDYGKYLEKKAQEEETVSHYLKAARLTERAYGVKATVAGYTVIRDPQMNLIVGLGTHEQSGVSDLVPANNIATRFIWTNLFKKGFAKQVAGSLQLGATAQYKGIFHVSDEVARNNWYEISDYIHDSKAVSTQLGEAWAINTDSNSKLQKSIDEGTARFFLSPVTMHNGNLWSKRAISLYLEFYTQVCGYNNGELSDPTTKPIDTKNCSVGYAALIFTSLAFCALIGALMSITALLLSTDLFKSCKRALPEARMDLKGKNFVLYLIATTFAGFAGAYGAQMSDESFTLSNMSMSKWLPWEPGQLRCFQMLFLTAFFGFILYFIIGRLNKKNNTQCMSTIKEMSINFKDVLKTFGIALLLFAASYAAANAINLFFDSRFMLIDGSYDVMKNYSFGRLFRYFILILPATLVISTLNNKVIFKNVSDSADTALNVLFTSLGMILLMLISFGYTYSNIGNPDIFHIQCTLSIIPLVPICNYCYRKFYKLTGSVWLGAFFVAILISWRCAGYISHQFMWYGSNEVAAFWGIY